VHDALASATDRQPTPRDQAELVELEHQIEHAAHFLPSQGPITVFIHHNTLHAFEDLPFDEGVRAGAATYGCQPYLPEDYYRREVIRRRILPADLAEVLIEELGEDADVLIGFMGTRYHLRLAMLEHPLRLGTDEELRWLIADTDALHRFRAEAPPDARRWIVEQTRHWILRDYLDGRAERPRPAPDVVTALLDQFGAGPQERWTERTWESFSLHLLWRVCHTGVHGVRSAVEPEPLPRRHRDLLLLATGRDVDAMVNDVLIRFCAAYLDQGFAAWTLPGRDSGFFAAFVGLYRDSRPVEPWLRGLPGELRRLESAGLSPLGSIRESMELMGISQAERPEFLLQNLLALRGWAGMLSQMETNAEWTVHPAKRGSLVEYLAARLILKRLALGQVARETPGLPRDLGELRAALRHRVPHAPRVSVDQRAYLVFQLAQVRGWSPMDLHRQSRDGWGRLVQEIEGFGSLARRRTYHLAYERRYRNAVLDALIARDRAVARLTEPPPDGLSPGRDGPVPSFQVVCCLDEREESFRRHLEELEPSCETFGVAGFFGVAIYYRGVDEAHFRPLCPINIKPKHYVQEESIRSLEDASRLQAAARRRLGRLSHRMHVGTRGFLGGLLTGMLGSVASVPLLMRVLWPRSTDRLSRAFRRFVTPPVTQLRLERRRPEPGPENGHLGYTVEEMAGVVGGTLRALGLTRRFAPVVIVAGHGSASLNNPHEAAHDCGACGGNRGGPNARAFAQMANDPRVRRLLEARGLAIPDEAYFVGAFHNTCDDSVTYFDLDRLPDSHAEAFDEARRVIEAARRRDAHERCRRFESAPLTLTAEEALRHVEGRMADLSQVRPEYGHATNAACFVGRRSRTRGLFFDRRVFLTSYDPEQDDAEASVLAGLLAAAIPVCAGISLEYYFSFVDPTGYGCGTKLPHNVTSLLGVMDGAASDLRPGLPWQMIEIHEPLRVLFVIETTTEAMRGIMERSPAIARLVDRGWVQLATLDPRSTRLHVYRDGRFEPYEPRTDGLPTAPTSLAWYRGYRDHLAPALVGPEFEALNTRGEAAAP
jgi:uncharacterized protein YbcC (UPF0753/DUF2309 family)